MRCARGAGQAVDRAAGVQARCACAAGRRRSKWEAGRAGAIRPLRMWLHPHMCAFAHTHFSATHCRGCTVATVLAFWPHCTAVHCAPSLDPAISSDFCGAPSLLCWDPEMRYVLSAAPLHVYPVPRTSRHRHRHVSSPRLRPDAPISISYAASGGTRTGRMPLQPYLNHSLDHLHEARRALATRNSPLLRQLATLPTLPSCTGV